MTEYYVSTTGSDANKGTQLAPWLTPQNAVGKLKPGDTLWFFPGTYNTANAHYGFFYTKDSGKAGQPITYKSMTPLAAKLTSPGTDAPPCTWYNEGNYIVIDGFDMSCDGSNFIIETNANHTIIKNCYCHDESGGVTGSAITLGSGFFDNWAINCVVDHIGYNAGNSNQIQGIYVSSAYGGVLNCRVSRCAGWGIHLWHSATNCLVLNNLVYNCGFNGGTTGGGFMIANDGLNATYPQNVGTIVANNISCYNNGYGLRETVAVGLNTYTNNLFWQNAQGPYGVVVSPSQMLNNVIADPRFVNYQNDNTGDYHLLPISPAINAGLDVSSYGLTYDLGGKARPQMGGWDIGPYEYGTTSYVL